MIYAITKTYINYVKRHLIVPTRIEAPEPQISENKTIVFQLHLFFQ